MARNRLRERLRRRSEKLAQGWSRRRQGIDRLPLTLVTRRLYILPTGTGLAYAAMVLAILAAGLNYANGLVILLGFLLAGVGLSTLHQCHGRLLRVVVERLAIEDAHAGSALRVQLGLADAPGLAADEYRLSLRADDGSLHEARGEGAADAPDFCLRPIAQRRGIWQLPPLRLDCDAPSGLFRCWVWLHLDAQALVYPRPEGGQALPIAPDEEGSADGLSAGQEEWFALRPFREGDSPRHAAWKVHARGLPLQSQEWRGAAGHRYHFDYARLTGLDTESRLSQLAAWLLEAARRQEACALSLPGRQIDMACGVDHTRACLEALARYGSPS